MSDIRGNKQDPWIGAADADLNSPRRTLVPANLLEVL